MKKARVPANGFLHKQLSIPWPERRIHALAWVFALALGILQAWAHRHTMTVDGLSYVDIAENLWQTDWAHAATGHWSPLFPASIAIAMALARPSPEWEFFLVHTVEFILYLGALTAFTFLLSELLRLRDQDAAKHGRSMLPRDALLVLGYSTFIWTSLALITVHGVTPDMLMAGLLYLVAALVVRIRRGAAGMPAWIALGAILGLGYLTKTIFLLIAPAFLVAAYWVEPNRGRALGRAALAVIIWLAVAAPWIGLLSDAYGRFTIGEAGRDTYAWEVVGISSPYWEEGPPGQGAPLHPPRLIHQNPRVYEFAEPVDGTYPVWYDPSWWYEGVQPQVALSRQLVAIQRSVFMYLRIVDVFLLGSFILFLISIRDPSDLVRPVYANGFLLLPSVLALFLYSLVLVMDRYMAGYWTVAFLALMLGIQFPDSFPAPRIYRAGALAIVFVLMAKLLVLAASDFRRVLQPPEDFARNVAVKLGEMGVEPGDRVAWIGGNLLADWARLARVRIVAEVPIGDSELFWSADEETRKEILERLAAAGAEAVYAYGVPSWADTTDWTKVSDYRFARRLRP